MKGLIERERKRRIIPGFADAGGEYRDSHKKGES
jgi:hypothetical protein